MKLTDIQLDLAAAYVKEELSGKALTDFEAAIGINEVLREEVVFQRGILGALRLNVAAATLEQAMLDNVLDDGTLHPEFEHTQRVAQQAHIANINRQRRIRKWAVSGLAMAACVLGVFFFGPTIIYNQQLNNEIANFEVTFDSGSTFEEVGSSDDMEQQIKIAKDQYAKGNPKAALATLNQIEGETLDYILLAKGKMQAQLKNYKESESLLLTAAKSNQISIEDDARLALVVLYLRLGEEGEAKKQSEEIETESKEKEAKELLKKYQRKTIL